MADDLYDQSISKGLTIKEARAMANTDAENAMKKHGSFT